MSLYLDNAAAVPCSPDLLASFTEFAAKYPGNQESMGWHGAAGAKAVSEADRNICRTFALPDSFHAVFMNTGTEVLSAAVEAVCANLRHGEVLTTSLEHPALEESLRRSCSYHNLNLKICPADRNGLDYNALKSLLSAETAFVAVHHVQSETGEILDLLLLRKLMDSLCPHAILLLDTMQSAGKIEIPVQMIRPDLLSVSGQKIGCPGGAALLCASKMIRTVRSLRSRFHFNGRCIPAMCLTLAKAVETAVSGQEKRMQHIAENRVALVSLLKEHIPSLQLTLPLEKTSPYILHLRSTPYQGAILTRALHPYEISIAPGSACESETPSGSRALGAMKYAPKDCFCGLRISFWEPLCERDLCFFAEKLAQCIKKY